MHPLGSVYIANTFFPVPWKERPIRTQVGSFDGQIDIPPQTLTVQHPKDKLS